MTITSVKVNNRTHSIVIEANGKVYHLPFARLRVKPTGMDAIESIEIDEELGKQAITYRLVSGAEDSVHIDAFLDYNKDTDYMRKLHLYKLTLRCLDVIDRSGVSKREIARRMGTSNSQLLRLLDTTNTTKTIDQLVRLLNCLGAEVGFDIQFPELEKNIPCESIRNKFRFISAAEFAGIPQSSTFNPILKEKRKAA